MDIIVSLYHLIDEFLMPFYRFPGNPLAGYYLGTLVLSLASVVIGELSISIAFRINRKMIARENQEINHYQDLSVEALKAGDKAAFRACNSIANEAYGKSFFSQITLSAASLWPLFIALGWMQYRFGGVEFHLPFTIPLAGSAYGYFPTFLFTYIFMRIVMTRFMRMTFRSPHGQT